MCRIFINFNLFSYHNFRNGLQTVPGLNSELLQMNHLILSVKQLSLELSNKPYLVFGVNLSYTLQPHQCKQLEEMGTCNHNISTDMHA